MPLTEKTKHVLIWLIPLVFVLLLVPFSFYATPLTGLGPSQAIAINLAVKNHLVFGKDVVFSFGPLSVLLFRYPIFINKYLFLLSDLFFFYVLFVGFRAIIKRNLQWAPVIFLVACVLVCQNMDIDKWYFLLTLLFSFLFLETPARNDYLLYAGILSLICLYIDTGILPLFIFAATIIYAMISRKVGWLRSAVIIDVYLVAILGSTRILHTDLPGYIIGSIQLMKDNANVMYLPLAGRFGEIAGWGAAILILLFLVCYTLFLVKWIGKRKSPRDSDALFIYLLVAVALFAWYKSGFVKADDHVRNFFQMVAPLTLLLYLFTPGDLWRKVIASCCWAILTADMVVTALVPVSRLPDSYGELVRGALIPVKIRDIKNYLKQFGEYDKQLAHYRTMTALPNKYRDAIHGHTTDIVPSEISTIYFNGLNYDPRPTLQSDVAYNPYLDSLNASKYMSARAPEYVLFSLDPAEDRFAWTDETKIKLALLQRYRFVQKIGDQLLLRRRETPRRLIKMEEDTIKAQLGIEIPLKKPRGSQIEFTRFIIHYNWNGQLRNFFYQPRPLQIVYRTDDGDVQYHNAYLPICADGMILNKFVDDTREFRLFLLSDGDLNADVRSICIQPVSPGGYAPGITMVNTWYTVEDKSRAEQREDSLDIGQLVNGNSTINPLSQPPSDAEGSAIRYNIQSYRDHGGLIRLQGWAMPEKESDSDYVVKTLARSASGLVYPFFSEKFKVPVFPADLRNRTDLDSVGVLSIVAKNQLPAGNYQVGLALYNRRTGRSLVSYVDRFFQVDKQYPILRVTRMSAGSVDKDSVNYHIDSVDNSDEGLNIQGWGFLTSAKTSMTVALLLQNDTATYRIPVNRRRRVDIMAAYKKPIAEYSGFSVNVARKDLPDGVFSAGLEITSPDGKTQSWKFSDQKIPFGITGKNMPVRAKSLPPPKDFTSNIDMVTCEGETIRVGGWAISDTMRNKDDLIEVVLKGDIYTFTAPVDKTLRPDIAARLKRRIANCGFDATIDPDPLPIGKYRLGLIIHQPGKPGFVRFFDKIIVKK